MRSSQDCSTCHDDHFDRLGRACTETVEEHTDRDTLLLHLMEGPVRIVSFNAGEGWSQDLGGDRRPRTAPGLRGATEVPPSLEEFPECFVESTPLQLSRYRRPLHVARAA